MFIGHEIALATNGELRGPDVSVCGITTDSRRVQAGELFVALRGERFDGHQFVPAVVAAGAAAVLVDREWAAAWEGDLGCSCIVVNDTLHALGDLAAAWRRRFVLPVVGVTGSNGKTTVKEMLAAILALTGPGLKTEGNLNNLIGLPQMLFRLAQADQWAVLEMGMSELGEIDRLAEIAAPEVGIITNVNAAHLASMNSLETVALAKGELFLRLPAAGWAIYNADDQRVKACPVPAGVRRLGFGLRAGEVTARQVTAMGAGQRFVLELPAGSVEVNLPVPGEHNLMDALAAAAAAMVIGVPLATIAAGLAGFVPYRQRFNLLPVGGITLVDDTYNANPASMAAALSTLASCPVSGRRIVVLGEMRELGSDEVTLHRQVGRQAAAIAQRLVVLGDLGKEIAGGAREAGMAVESVTVATSHDEIVGLLAAEAAAGDWILVKGSRGMTMEQVVNGLRARLSTVDVKEA